MFERKVTLPDIFLQLLLPVTEDIEELLFTADFVGAAVQKKEEGIDLDIFRLLIVCGWENEILVPAGEERDAAAGKQLLIETGVLQMVGTGAEIAEMKGADGEKA